MFSQWDIVWVRINPTDKDEHPAIVLSRAEACSDPRRQTVNVLYGTTRRPAEGVPLLAVQLNGADGVECATIFDCAQIYVVSKAKISGVIGRVTVERRRQVSRKIVEAYRLIL
ncbi:MAG: type II toxin-antitoxin system PemK/MazF family toxin [Verrucomicrobia bacterium]|nr:type II toxin-antitoxin system PemK/MazF family toxin [Verrucomicrobiota bacterium]